jgi:hypothetical protein
VILKFLSNQTTRDNGKYPKVTIYKIFNFSGNRYLATFNDFNQLSISKVIVVKNLGELAELEIED